MLAFLKPGLPHMKRASLNGTQISGFEEFFYTHETNSLNSAGHSLLTIFILGALRSSLGNLT